MFKAYWGERVSIMLKIIGLYKAFRLMDVAKYIHYASFDRACR